MRTGQPKQVKRASLPRFPGKGFKVVEAIEGHLWDSRFVLVEIDSGTAGGHALPEASGTSFEYLEQLLAMLAQLIREASWPRSTQGEFLDYAVRDVYEFAVAISTEAKADRWTVATSLLRPLQERSEYALAAAVDPKFPRTYLKHMGTQVDKEFAGRSRLLSEIARGTIHRWATESHGEDQLLEASKTLNSIGSELLHHGIGFSSEAEEVKRLRPELLGMAAGRVQCATAKVMLSIKTMGGDQTEAWQRAWGIVTLI